MSDLQEYVSWSPELSVGIQELDEQHKILVALVNRLYNEAILKKADNATIGSVLNELIQYTIIHFAVEESLFRIFDYPESDAHQEQHSKLKEDSLKIQEKFNNGTPVDIELMKFLRHWLRHHILIDDKRYGVFFLEKGVKSNWSGNRSWARKIWDSVFPR